MAVSPPRQFRADTAPPPLTLLTALGFLLGACGDRPPDLSAPARNTCEDQLSQKLGGFPGFPADPRNESSPITEDRQAFAFRLRGVVQADGIRGIYDCEVMSPDSGRSWKVRDLKFNLLERPEPVP